MRIDEEILQHDNCTLSIEECVLKLIAISLSAEASSIAIRFDALERKIQVVDNGAGITKKSLLFWGRNADELKSRNIILNHSVLDKIAKNCQNLVITSRTCLSRNTYVKVFNKGFPPKLMKGVHRPSIGTTISIKGFCLPIYESAQSVIYEAVSGFAVLNNQVSFSLRDDLSKKVILGIPKYQDPLETIGKICNPVLRERNIWHIKSSSRFFHCLEGFLGFIAKYNDAFPRIFLNNATIRCKAIEEIIHQVITKVQQFSETRQLLPGKVFYLFNIKCCPDDYVTSFVDNEIHAEFVNPNILISLKESLKNSVIKSLRKLMTNDDLKNLKKLLYKETSCESKSRNKMENPETKAFVKKLSELLIIEADKKVRSLDSQAVVAYKSFQKNVENHVTSRRKLSRSLFESVNKNDNSSEEKTDKFIDSELSDITSSEDFSDRFPVELCTVEHETFLNQISLEPSETFGKLVLQDQRFQENEEISQLSDWTSWSYHSDPDSRRLVHTKEGNFAQEDGNTYQFRRFTFLPLTLHNILIGRGEKVMNIKLAENDDENVRFQLATKNVDMLSNRYQDSNVRNCEKSRKTWEVRLDKECIRNMKVLSQVNREIIAAVTIQDNRKILVLIDQHAIDERIRYEQLLERYRYRGKKDEYISQSLKSPMKMFDLDETVCKLVMSNRNVLQKFGLFCEMEKENKLLVTAVPKCFLRSNYWNDDSKLITSTRKLLLEVTDSLTSTNTIMILPSSIHYAIATEACRGAIKFGNQLTVKQCEALLKSLQNTQGPTRCAHGRPSIIPVLDVTNIHSKTTVHVDEKLNFSLLKNFRSRKV